VEGKCEAVAGGLDVVGEGVDWEWEDDEVGDERGRGGLTKIFIKTSEMRQPITNATFPTDPNSGFGFMDDSTVPTAARVTEASGRSLPQCWQTIAGSRFSCAQEA
jgi:hypothetical protein